MGAEESKSSGSSGSPSYASGAVDFPNAWKSEATAWTLLHQCTLDKWKEGHAEAANFRETVLTCEGVVHKDCSYSFCMSRQGIININKGSSFFSFRKRSKFAKMAEHFEYNHIPAQLSSIHHFRVKSVLCYRDSLVVLHLSRSISQFGLLDLRSNKFMGIFGKQSIEFDNEVLAGQISPDKSKCLIKVPNMAGPRGQQRMDLFQLYDLHTKMLVAEADLSTGQCHFCFDPRFSWKRIAVTNFEPNQNNSLSLLEVDSSTVIKTNPRMIDTRPALYPYMKDLCYTRDGHLILATILDTICFCRDKKTRNYRPINCSIYVFSGDTTETLHCIQYQRYTCTQHYCPINHTPVFSTCGNRMALVMNMPDLPSQHFVQVYRLPCPLNLQNMCRIVILQNFALEILPDLPLPVKLINSLHFKPEFH